MHFDLDGEAVVTDDTKLVAAETGEDTIDVTGGTGVKWVASFAPRSRVRIGDTITIAVDVERMHWFDPGTSEAIRLVRCLGVRLPSFGQRSKEALDERHPGEHDRGPDRLIPAQRLAEQRHAQQDRHQRAGVGDRRGRQRPGQA